VRRSGARDTVRVTPGPVLSNAIDLLLRTGGVPLRRSCVAATAGFRPADLLTCSKIPAASRTGECSAIGVRSWAVGHRRDWATRRTHRHQSIRRARERLVAEKGPLI